MDWQPDAEQQLAACREELLRIECMLYRRVWHRYNTRTSLEEFAQWLQENLR